MSIVVGIIDLGNLDRYKRVSRFVFGQSGELPVLNFLHELSIVDDDYLQLSGNGHNHALQIIYVIKNMLTKNVLQNVHCLAYEVMLNHAMNEYWDNVEDSHFKTYFPFMEENELFHLLMNSKRPEVHKTMYRIRFRQPYAFAGHYHLDLKKDSVQCWHIDIPPGNTLHLRRRKVLLDKFNEIITKKNLNGKCFVRLGQNFGRSTNKELLTIFNGDDYKKWKSDNPRWLDIDETFVEHDEFRTDDGQPGYGKLSKVEDHENLIQWIRDEDERRRRSLWLFIQDDNAETRKKVEGVARELGVEEIEK